MRCPLPSNMKHFTLTSHSVTTDWCSQTRPKHSQNADDDFDFILMHSPIFVSIIFLSKMTRSSSSSVSLVLDGDQVDLLHNTLSHWERSAPATRVGRLRCRHHRK